MKPETDKLLGVDTSHLLTSWEQDVVPVPPTLPYLILLNPASLLGSAVPRSCHTWVIGLYPCKGPGDFPCLEPLGQGYGENMAEQRSGHGARACHGDPGMISRPSRAGCLGSMEACQTSVLTLRLREKASRMAERRLGLSACRPSKVAGGSSTSSWLMLL